MSELIRTLPPICTCRHPVDCVCACHGRYCDPTENACLLEYLPDEGGLTAWGCNLCTPGQGAPHVIGCAADPALLVRIQDPSVGYLRPG